MPPSPLWGECARQGGRLWEDNGSRRTVSWLWVPLAWPVSAKCGGSDSFSLVGCHCWLAQQCVFFTAGVWGRALGTPPECSPQADSSAVAPFVIRI